MNIPREVVELINTIIEDICETDPAPPGPDRLSIKVADLRTILESRFEEVALLSTAPMQSQPLTDDELWKFWWNRPEVPEGEDDSTMAEFVAAVRAILAAHGITKAQP